ncbi:MAG: histone-like protein [Candidatus Helarchaeota archaeon]
MAKSKKKPKKAPEKPKKEPAKVKKPTAKATTSEARIITKSALRRLMKEKADAELVASSAIEVLMNYLQGLAKDLTTKSLKIVENAKRKTITKDDIILAIKE